jgi:hypothetical protein
MLFSDAPGDRNCLWNDLESGPYLERFLQSDPPWHTSSTIWKRESLYSFGGFNELVFYGDDSDLHVHSLLQGLRFKTFPADLPDIFIRRSNQSRITNTLPEQLINSRLTRLTQGTKLLNRMNANYKLMKIWEGQYFMEAEFHLFNNPNANNVVPTILRLWKENNLLVSFRFFQATVYLNIALATKRKAYFLLRLARRIARSLLPPYYFPSHKSFLENTKLSHDLYLKLISKLHIDRSNLSKFQST